MSIADAMRARELEARVAELERRVALIEEPLGKPEPRPTPTNSVPKTEPSPQARAFAENLAPGRSRVKADDAA